MSIRHMISDYKNNGTDFVFVKMDTLKERLRRIRAMNSKTSHSGIIQYNHKGHTIDRDLFKEK